MTLLSEEQRLAALAGYDVLDTPAEPAFDDLTQLACRLCEVPIALVSLVDHDRQWFKSCVGLDARETPRAVAFCAHAIQREAPLIITDARADARFADNPLVTGPPHIRFYAGFPLIDDSGAALGTLCVIDARARTLNDVQMSALHVLARQVVAQLQLRRVSSALREELGRQAELARARERQQAELLARETELRTQIEKAHRRASFLADTGKLLAASLDIDRTLETVAQMAVPRVADLCSIMLCQEDGSLRRVAEAALDAASTARMRTLREKAVSGDGLAAMNHALELGRPVVFADYLSWLRQRLPTQHPYLQTMTDLDVTSGLCAPIAVGGRTLGVLNVAVQRASGRTYDADDAVTMGELAQRAAVALDHARLFAEAQRERARAEQANHTKDHFLATVSHDLRNPLNAILGWTQMMRRRKGDADLAERATAVIERSVKAQSQLIEDLLDVSRMETGQLRVEHEPIDLVAVVEGALEGLRPTADTHGVTIQCRVDSTSLLVIGDSGRLQQVVWNLVNNAIKFARSGGQVQVVLSLDGERARLTVTDDGRGISGELLPHIFERFRQDGDGVGRRKGGLGLGLAIAKHIVEALEGTITAHSDGEGQGATFTVCLPLCPAIAATSALGSPRQPRGREAETSGETDVDTSALEGARVLVVDDDPDTRAALADLLTAHGVKVQSAGSAEEGFITFCKARPDILVSDIIMNGLSGYDLVRQVRDLSPQDGGRTPALALTGSSQAVDRTRALAAGFDLYVPKPVEPSELLTVLSSLRGRSRSSL
jgi:signal transduction histidine kinase/ActR/RegA family two-component response regulator